MLKGIQNAPWLYFASASICIVAGVLLTTSIPYRIYIALVFYAAAAGLIGLGIWEAVIRADRHLILENEILRIFPAKLTKIDGNQLLQPKKEIVISCFGVILGSDAVKYNRKDVRLWQVEIGRHSIKLIYGTQTKRKQLEILHEPINEADAHKLAERFHMETGAEILHVDSCLE